MSRSIFALLLAFACGAACAADRAIGSGVTASADPLATLRPGHPRLLLSDAELAANIAAAKNDPLRAALHTRIVALADAELGSTPISRVLAGPRLLAQSRRCVARVLTCAMAFRLTGDSRYADRAKTEMLAAAAFPDWNPSHFLDVAEMSLALAIGYDWLHKHLTAEERSAIKAALLKHALAFAPEAYAPNGPKDSPATRWVVRHNNWNQVCNAGLLAAALALADEEPVLARTVITGAAKSLPLAMVAYAPDGAYPEGPGYWEYGTTYNVIALAMLESALGHDFGLGRAAGFDRTALYRLYIQSPIGLGFNYADGNAGLSVAPAFTWLAARLPAEPFALARCAALLAEGIESKRSGQFFALHAVWFPALEAKKNGTVVADPPLDAHFRGPAELALFRSAWNDPRALFVGFKAGRNDVSHAHLDLGSFVLDADGVRWAQDLGPDNYNLPDYWAANQGGKRWTYYRLNNHSHTTLTPTDALQEPSAVAAITAFGSTPARAFAVADLTSAYPDAARRMLRGIAVLDRARVLVQDDIAGLKARTPLSWRLLTGATVSIEAPHRALLTQHGRTLRVEILAPARARFVTSPATPPTAGEKQNEGITVLTAELMPDTADVRLAVLLTPVGDRWPASLARPALSSLTEW